MSSLSSFIKKPKKSFILNVDLYKINPYKSLVLI